MFARFKELADKKKNDHRLRHRGAGPQPPQQPPAAACELVSHVVNAGDGVPNTSCIKLQRDDEVLEEVAIGSGPLDASFKAINRMLHMDVKLDSFSLNAVTDGEDAIGEAVVKVSVTRRRDLHRHGPFHGYHRVLHPGLCQRHQQDDGQPPAEERGAKSHGNDNDAEDPGPPRGTGPVCGRGS